MIVTAVVLVDDRAGVPDPLVPIGDTAMLVHAVRAVLDSEVANRVVVLDRPNRARSLRAACRGLPVSVHAELASIPVGTHVDQRAASGGGDGPITIGPEEIVLLHQANRPLAPPELVVAVVAAVRDGAAAAVPVLPMADTVKLVDASGLVRAAPDRAALRVVQGPQAIRRELLTAPPWDTAALRLAESGAPVRSVAGHPRAFAVRSSWDLELARLLVERGAR